MSDTTDADNLGDTGIAPSQLAPGTFKDCGAEPSSSSARIENSEVVRIAELLEPVYRQTATLFCWATGVTKQGEINDATVERFCFVMQLIDRRLGSNPKHFEGTVEDAIEAARKNGVRPRDRSTIARHRNRLARLRDYPLPPLEARARSQGWIKLNSGEAAHLAGAGEHRGFLLVERLGTIMVVHPLMTFDLMMRTSSSSADLAPILVQEAAQALAAQQEQGRAFVGTLHNDRILIVQGFWNAL